MITCEDALDTSFLSSEVAPVISGALANTSVGEVREHFHQQLSKCMLAELCEEDPADADLGESIFEPGSRMGLQPEESEAHWVRDETMATWTRLTVVPRSTVYFPDEGGETRGDFAPQAPHPRVSSLRDARLTIRRDGKRVAAIGEPRTRRSSSVVQMV